MANAVKQRAVVPAGQSPKPFLKWAGGKSQLVPRILARFPKTFRRYHEPFLGGGAVFFALQPKSCILSDINGELVETYKAVRDDVQGVMQLLRQQRVDEEHYYAVRESSTAGLSTVESAARTIFLNKTCFNGLYRVNRQGKFNVPFGRYSNPNLFREENLLLASAALRKAELRIQSAFDVVSQVKKGDLVYFDPPYDPVSSTASFTSYAKDAFGKAEQEQLAEVFAQLASRGVAVVLSNSDTPFIRKLYRKFRVEKVYARRAINSRADRRGPVSEVLVSSQ